MTVYDAIKSMSRESMARFLGRIDTGASIGSALCGKKCPRKAQCIDGECVYHQRDCDDDIYRDLLGMDADYAMPRIVSREWVE